MIVYRISLYNNGKNSFVTSDIKEVFSILKDADLWDVFVIGKIEMTMEEFKNLPEFNGF